MRGRLRRTRELTHHGLADLRRHRAVELHHRRAGALASRQAPRDRRVALVVDELLGQQDAVIKRFDRVRGALDCFSGATILGNGRPALIVDVGRLLLQATSLVIGAGVVGVADWAASQAALVAVGFVAKKEDASGWGRRRRRRRREKRLSVVLRTSRTSRQRRTARFESVLAGAFSRRLRPNRETLAAAVELVGEEVQHRPRIDVEALRFLVLVGRRVVGGGLRQIFAEQEQRRAEKPGIDRGHARLRLSHPIGLAGTKETLNRFGLPDSTFFFAALRLSAWAEKA